MVVVFRDDEVFGENCLSGELMMEWGLTEDMRLRGLREAAWACGKWMKLANKFAHSSFHFIHSQIDTQNGHP